MVASRSRMIDRILVQSWCYWAVILVGIVGQSLTFDKGYEVIWGGFHVVINTKTTLLHWESFHL